MVFFTFTGLVWILARDLCGAIVVFFQRLRGAHQVGYIVCGR